MANISFMKPLADEGEFAPRREFDTEVDCGFNLPTAYKSHDGQLNQLVAIATLFASVGIAAILAFEMLRGAI